MNLHYSLLKCDAYAHDKISLFNAQPQLDVYIYKHDILVRHFTLPMMGEEKVKRIMRQRIIHDVSKCQVEGC